MRASSARTTPRGSVDHTRTCSSRCTHRRRRCSRRRIAPRAVRVPSPHSLQGVVELGSHRSGEPHGCDARVRHTCTGLARAVLAEVPALRSVREEVHLALTRRVARVALEAAGITASEIRREADVSGQGYRHAVAIRAAAALLVHACHVGRPDVVRAQGAGGRGSQLGVIGAGTADPVTQLCSIAALPCRRRPADRLAGLHAIGRTIGPGPGAVLRHIARSGGSAARGLRTEKRVRWGSRRRLHRSALRCRRDRHTVYGPADGAGIKLHIAAVTSSSPSHMSATSQSPRSPSAERLPPPERCSSRSSNNPACSRTIHLGSIHCPLPQVKPAVMVRIRNTLFVVLPET